MSEWLDIWWALWRWRWWHDAGAEVARRAALHCAQADAPAIVSLRERMQRIEQVARWMPRSRCLDRALALVEWADANALCATLCIGVRNQHGRVQAHAWVQSGNSILDPDPESIRQFALLQAGALPAEFDR